MKKQKINCLLPTLGSLSLAFILAVATPGVVSHAAIFGGSSVVGTQNGNTSVTNSTNSNVIHGSGNVVSKYREVPANFSVSGVSDSSSIRVNVIPSAKNEVQVTAEDNILPYVETFFTNDKLTVKLTDGYSINSTKPITVNLYSSMGLQNISASSSSVVTVQGKITATNLKVNASSSARVNLNRLDVTNLSVKATSSASVTATQSSSISSLDLNSSSSAVVDLSKITAKTGKITATTSSNSKVNIEKVQSQHVNTSAHLTNLAPQQSTTSKPAVTKPSQAKTTPVKNPWGNWFTRPTHFYFYW
ncbi:GIN domain-containing protein [Listeria valentina]|uniref:GIN domain-containing protein n=1 Tax=Listeria valentina TaxID=2705293 RepID=UPI00143104D4|nr:DUF2807 domain-containing protein [Listeria valentina]